jgi:hypothetical protein
MAREEGRGSLPVLGFLGRSTEYNECKFVRPYRMPKAT